MSTPVNIKGHKELKKSADRKEKGDSAAYTVVSLNHTWPATN